ncbi:cytochrome c oxidase cbb3-type subunit 2 [Geoalkalibacter ferrihydriticus]|uniref:Bifunctional cbb3-type cytochrome c oxidase subunit II/cytochrome c n=2 Tax=Geoalkalibacter ferrihydriticus TaxID=392333 RepID=A0A0C2DS83_9BACT|nr:cbb3-type cytochrome c oxidase subunit II [Geoalkalibacter ferrihydriticus]KIH76319.1 bifunctional cbb3-type cytochrome c oxidase subunit II/cytochrome c [Geoalkalibacter ferrihydriticus DSM 17813]SDL21008.1 cytochrome c oxidase cbb3-type subunit 2 [Geoalkalibacter ferrihydriticus]
MFGSWEIKPSVFLALATLAILVGTVVTMVLPFAWINTEGDRIEGVTPYNPLELAGRDVYIREGCNNCHTQTIRPLVAEVLRYGDYSRAGEFVHDRPHLWGSRRTGPDLARIGGKYPDAWHYQHMADPTVFVPRSNMPAYAFLNNRQVDPDLTRRKMEILRFPYEVEQISALRGKTEMDAIVAYMQKLGTGVERTEVAATLASPTTDKNPFGDDPQALKEGADLYRQHCAACHGADLQGGIGPELATPGRDDADLFQVIFHGIIEGGMPSYATLGQERVWKMVGYIQSRQE